jgi:glycosyltransferase involved in cell wall biosynthesis
LKQRPDVRVLVVHNFYRSELPSGENRAVEQEIVALRAHDVDVQLYGRSSDEIADFGPVGKASLAWRPIYSHEDRGRLREQLDAFRPDVVHLHNPYPLVSPASITAAHRAGIPVVQTVHNYRHACPAGTFFRDGKVCVECEGRALTWPAVRHGCYRNSSAQSIPITLALAVHKRTWRGVERYLAVSDFVAEKLVGTGVSADRVRVVPNGADDPGPPAPIGTGFVFVGRLTDEKGVALLLDAWRAASLPAGTRLVIIGDGPQRDLVEARAREDRAIEVRGILPSADVARALADAAVVVIPSVCFEGFPVVAAEAMAHGRPILASDLGALHSVVDDEIGWRAAAEPVAFARALESAIGAVDLADRAANARKRFLARYRRDVVTNELVSQLGEVAELGCT